MAAHQHIPLEKHFRPPTRTEASISPDDTRIVNLAPWRPERLGVGGLTSERELAVLRGASPLTRPAACSATNRPMIHGGCSAPTTTVVTRTGTSTASISTTRRRPPSTSRRFRGSTGHGEDAVDWAVDNGYADRDWVAIRWLRHPGRRHLHPQVFAAAIDHVSTSSLESSCEPFLRLHERIRPTTGIRSSVTTTIPSSGRTCLRAHRWPGWIRSAGRCWFFKAPTTFEWFRRSPTIPSRRCVPAGSGMFRLIDRFLGEHLPVRRMEHTA
jgi:hypothetical protein